MSDFVLVDGPGEGSADRNSPAARQALPTERVSSALADESPLDEACWWMGFVACGDRSILVTTRRLDVALGRSF
jgi:hypothetical protein